MALFLYTYGNNSKSTTMMCPICVNHGLLTIRLKILQYIQGDKEIEKATKAN